VKNLPEGKEALSGSFPFQILLMPYSHVSQIDPRICFRSLPERLQLVRGFSLPYRALVRSGPAVRLMRPNLSRGLSIASRSFVRRGLAWDRRWIRSVNSSRFKGSNPPAASADARIEVSALTQRTERCLLEVVRVHLGFCLLTRRVGTKN